MKKHFLFLSVCFLFSFALVAQQASLPFVSISKNDTKWVKFNQSKNIEASYVFEKYANAFGLGSLNTMKQLKTETDKLGFTHIRYQQNYQGVPVRGAVYLIHSQNGKAVSGNGLIVKDIQLKVQPQLSGEEAIFKAIAYTGAENYMWESASAELKLKEIKSNQSASYYPVPELMIVDQKCSGIASQYKLAYRIDIFAEKPMSRKYVFVDAQTGAILFTENRIHTTDVTGTALTKYAGTQNIITDSVSPGVYRLRQATTGGGIETYDMNKGTDYGTAVDFTDTDNYWNNINADQDEAATDAHFAATKTYEYYFKTFGRLGYDNANAKLVNYVHYDVNYVNAFWNGSFMTFGDGDGTSYSALTSLDVCGHEITHAVDENSANLIYQDESGAMNEGFSDIFGTAIEFFADSAHADWNIGEDFDLSGTGFRSLSNPKASQLPDTYHGQYWVFNDVLDNGGVHTNCGVLAHWYYIMSEGKVGTNDLGHAYNVSGLGIDTASAVAYRALNVYLIPSSQYIDARQATIWAAEDLYGQCSVVALNAAAAWYAVGVGYPVTNYDLWMNKIIYPVTACGLGMENIQARLIYNGCIATFLAGDTIPVAFKVDGGSVVNDSIILASDLQGGDTLDFIFSVPADFSSTGTHTIDCWVNYDNDNQSGNDSIVGYQFESKLQQNIDMGITNITSPVSGCNMGNSEAVAVEVKFFGCDSVSAGSPIVLAYRVNSGAAVRDTITIPTTLYPSGTFSHVFTVPANLSNAGIYTIDAWTEYTPDTLNTNDMFSGYTVKNPITLSNDTIGFEESNLNNIINVETTNYSHALVSTVAHNTGTKGFQMTGGNFMDYMDQLELPTGSNTWMINEFLSAKINFCVDASAWSTVNLRFDLKQTHGGDLYTLYLGAGDYTVASNMRILIDGTQIGSTYNPTTSHADPYLTHFVNLDSYAGTKFTLTIETRNVAKDTSIMGPRILDNAYLDNICFSEQSQQDINENSHLQMVDVFPNPFNSVFTVKYDTDKNDEIAVNITDIMGKVIYTESWGVCMGSNKKTISVEDLPAGVYVLRISDKSGSISKRMIKQ
jgi:Zn-dependent metalloprotease